MKLSLFSTSAAAFVSAALLFGCSSGVAPVHAAGPTGVANILLVHGAWSDGSGWSKVIPLLQADGYNVVAVQLPLTSLSDDTAVVQRALAVMKGNVLLVGHSYGGAVITQAGSNPQVEGLVYVAAYGPDQGESVLSLGGTVPATPIMNDFTQDATGFLKLPAAGVAADFAQDPTPAEQAGIAVTQGPTNAPNALAGTITSTPAWKTLPSWYVIASNDRVVFAIGSRDETFSRVFALHRITSTVWNRAVVCPGVRHGLLGHRSLVRVSRDSIEPESSLAVL